MPVVVNKDGQRFNVGDDELQYFTERGFTSEAPEAYVGGLHTEAAKPVDRGLGAQIGAGIGSFVSGATLGASDVVLGSLSTDNERRQIAEDRAAHPLTSALASGAGAILPALVAPETLLGRAPAGVLGRAAIGGFEAGRELGGVAGTIGALAATGTEGALHAAGAYLSDTALGDRAMTAEGMAGALGHGFAFGAASGGALYGIEGGTMAARRMFARHADGGEQAAQAAEQAWERSAQETFQAHDAAAEVAYARLREAQAITTEAKLAKSRAGATFAEERAAGARGTPDAGIPEAVTIDAEELGQLASEYSATRAEFDAMRRRIAAESDGLTQRDVDLAAYRRLTGAAEPDLAVPVGEFGAPGRRGFGEPVEPPQIAGGTGADGTAQLRKPRLGDAVEVAPVEAQPSRLGDAAEELPREPAKPFDDDEYSAFKKSYGHAASETHYESEMFYSKGGDEIVNPELRSGKPLSPEGAKLRDQLDDAYKLPESRIPRDMVLYRGVSDEPIKGITGVKERFANTKPGDILEDPAYTSTAYSEKAKSRNEQVVFTISAPAGTPALPLRSKYTFEGEMLLPRNTKMRVDKIEILPVSDRWKMGDSKYEVLPDKSVKMWGSDGSVGIEPPIKDIHVTIIGEHAAPSTVRPAAVGLDAPVDKLTTRQLGEYQDALNKAFDTTPPGPEYEALSEKWNAAAARRRGLGDKSIPEPTADYVPGPAAPARAPGFQKIDRPAGGSQGGSWYSDETGQQWFGKHYEGNTDRLHGEHIANEIYRKFGVSAPETKIAQIDGKPMILSREIKGELPANTAVLNQSDINKGFVVDAWLGNRDVIGMAKDNIILVGDKAHRIDAGGATIWRAQGADKTFAAKVSELESMRDPTRKAGKIFGTLKREEVGRQLEDFVASYEKNRGDAEKIIDESGLSQTVKDRIRTGLNDRAAWLKAEARGAPKPLTDEEFNAFAADRQAAIPDKDGNMKAYSGMGLYSHINGPLRENAGKWGRGGLKPLPEPLRKIVQDIDAGIAASPAPRDMVVYRGVNGARSTAAMQKLKPGDVYVDPGFGSTSYLQGIGEDFSRGFEVRPGVQLEISIPEGYPAMPIPSNHPREREILLARDGRYIVRSVEDLGDGKKLIKMAVRAPDPAPPALELPDGFDLQAYDSSQQKIFRADAEVRHGLPKPDQVDHKVARDIMYVVKPSELADVGVTGAGKAVKWDPPEGGYLPIEVKVAKDGSYRLAPGGGDTLLAAAAAGDRPIVAQFWPVSTKGSGEELGDLAAAIRGATKAQAPAQVTTKIGFDELGLKFNPKSRSYFDADVPAATPSGSEHFTVDNKKLTLTTETKPSVVPGGRPRTTVTVTRVAGDGETVPVGTVEFVHHDEGLYPEHANVDQPWQRKGIGTRMYKAAEESAGKKVIPSENQTPEGKAFSAKYRGGGGETLTGLLRGTKAKLGDGVGLKEIGAPARAEYAAAKATKTSEAAEHFSAKARSESAAPLSPEEADALRGATGSSMGDKTRVGMLHYTDTENFIKLNQTLRGPSGASGLSAADAEVVAAVDRGLARTTAPRDFTVYRGTGKFGSDLKIGDSFVDGGYVSTSTSQAGAGAFRRGFNGSQGIEFQIRVPKGSHIASPPSEFTNLESELLLPRGSRFHVTSVTEQDGRKIISVTVDGGAGHPHSIRELETAHRTAVARVEASASPAEHVAAEREVQAIESQLSKVGARPGPVEDVAAMAEVVTKVERAGAKLTEALGADAPPLAQAHAKAFREAEAEVERKTVDRATRAIDDHVEASPPVAPGPTPIQRARIGKLDADAAYQRARANEVEAKIGSDAARKTASGSRTALKKATAVAGAEGGEIQRSRGRLGLIADIGTGLEIADTVGVPGLPRPKDIPLIGPVLQAFLRYRAARALMGRFTGRVPVTGESRAAALAAKTKDKVAKAVDRSLGFIEENAEKARGPAVSGGARTLEALRRRAFDDGEPDAKKDATLPQLAARRIREVAAAAADPQAVIAMVRKQTQGITDPDLIHAIEQLQIAMYQHLADTAPKAPPENPYSKREWAPPPAAAAQWARRLEVANDPAAAFEALHQQSLTPEAADTLRVAWPQLFKLGQERLVSRAADIKHPVPYRQRYYNSLLFQVPLDDSLQQENASILASAHAPVQPTPQAQPGAALVPSIAGPTSLSTIYQPASDRRAQMR